jgi:hypothetical protein
MNTLYKLLLIIILGLNTSSSFSQSHQVTNWDIQPSFKYDLLCALNVLTDDPYFLEFYKKDYKKFEPLFTDEAKVAFDTLRNRVRIKNQSIISAWFSLNFSVADDETLDELIDRLDHIDYMKEKLKKTIYYDDESWAEFVSMIPELKVIFQFLKEIEFDKYWSKEIKPKVEKRIAKMEEKISQKNIIPDIERKLGQAIDSDTINVYVLYFAQPYSIRITGTRFLTDISYSDKVLMNNAVHELIHDLDLETNIKTRNAIEKLKNDAFLMERFENRDVAIGYNTFETYVEENSVRALDEVINSKYGFAPYKTAKRRWKKQNNGMHVLAMALHYLMEKEDFYEGNEIYEDFIVRMIQEDKLVGKIQSIYNEIY